MKILYIGSEQSDAQAVTTALRDHDRDLTVSWAHGVADAVTWLREHRDVVALIVDAQINGGDCQPIVEHRRTLAPRPTLIVTLPAGTEPSFDSLDPEVDDYIPKGETFGRDLALALRRALGAAPGKPRSTRPSERRHDTQAHTDLEAALLRERAARGELEHKLGEATKAVEQADARQRQAIADAEKQLAAQKTRQAELDAALARERAARSELEQKLSDAGRALGQAEVRQRQATAEADKRLGAQKTQQGALDAALAHERTVRGELEQKLSDATRALAQAEARQRQAIADAETQLAAQKTDHSELAAALERERAERAELEQKLEDATRAFEQAEVRHRQAIADVETQVSTETTRHAEMEAARTHDRAARGELEQQLAAATAALAQAEEGHRQAIAAAEKQLADQKTQYEIGMARAAATWDMVDEQLRMAAREVEGARLSHAAAAADVERLTRRESELLGQLADAGAARAALEDRLASADAAAHAANARGEQERQAAAERLAQTQRALETRIAESLDERRRLEGRLADVERALEARVAEALDERRRVEERLAQVERARDEAEQQHAASLADIAAQARELENALQMARQSLATKATDLERLAQRETDLTTALGDVTSARIDLERRLAATEAAFEDATQRATRDRLAASKRAAEREAELNGQIQHERSQHDAAAKALAAADAAMRDAQRAHEHVLAAKSAELAALQGQFDRELSALTSDRDRAAQELRETAAALEQARRDHGSAITDVERLTQREATLSAQIAELEAARQALEQRFAEATAATERLEQRESALTGALREEQGARAETQQTLAATTASLREAEQRHDAAVTAAAAARAAQQARFERELAALTGDRDRLADRLNQSDAALSGLRDEHQSAVANAERLTTREAELNSTLTALQGVRETLEQQLASAAKAATESDAARQELERRLADAIAAIERGTQRESALDEQLRQEQAARTSTEQALAASNTALRDAEHRHRAEMAAAAAERTDRQAHFERELSALTGDRDRLANRLTESDAALDRLRTDHQAAGASIDRLTSREAELNSALAELHGIRQTLEQQLSDTSRSLTEAEARAANEQTAAAERQSDLERRLLQETTTRTALEQAAAESQAARHATQQRYEEALGAAANELAQRTSQFERERSELGADRDRLTQQLNDTSATLEQTRRDHQSATADVERLQHREAQLTSQLADLQTVRETLERQLAAAAQAIEEARQHAERERAAAAERQAELDARLVQEVAARTVIEQTLAEARAAAEDAGRAHQTAIDTLHAEAQEQHTRFEVQFAQERLEHETRVAEVEEARRKLSLDHVTLQQTMLTLQEQAARLERDLEVAKRRQDVLQGEANQLPALQQQLADARSENQRLFEQGTTAMFRCSRDGALTTANRACASLIGRRTLEELRGAHFASAVFDAPNVLSWLIDSAANTRARESVETTWRRKDGGRLFVRLSARPVGDLIEIAVEDLTRVRVLQERLAQAHRMEAVGRFASEVAVTCGNLLNDIQENGREWLTSVNGGRETRHHGELLFDEVARAAGLLRQLEACGEEQARTPMLVDLNTLIWDLEPVLKRVAGGDVDVQLRDTSSPLHVDVGTERIERLLVNLAGFGRGRLPVGGRLKIELGTSVVDRHFVAKHPNVRLGLHALITVTEVKRADESAASARERDRRSGQAANGKPAPRAGVDFATIQRLVSECGGHLWMQMQPRGEMVAKIRLPLSTAPEQTVVRPAAVRAPRERLVSRLFQS